MQEATIAWIDSMVDRRGVALRVVAPEGSRSPTVTVITLPDGMHGPEVSDAIKARGFNPYKALSWSHVGVAAGAFTKVADLVGVPNAPFASFPTLTPTPTAAEIAKALLQEPFRAYWEGPDLKTGNE